MMPFSFVIQKFSLSHAHIAIRSLVKNFIFIVMMLSSFGAVAEGAKDLEAFEGMSVTGGNEQPQVLYIVPWQPPSYQKRAEHPPKKELSGIIKPIDPAFHNEDFHFRNKLEVRVQTLSGGK